jgi:uncharacterized caspase-like protein
MKPLYAVILSFALLFQIDECFAQKRLALVVGIGAYSSEVGKLNNPTHDADLVESALKTAGFDVIPFERDAGKARLLQKIEEFGLALGRAGAGSIGFFYYSGHGAARPENGTNYLIPRDVKSLQNSMAWFEAIPLDDVIREVNRLSPNAVHFFVFDACRSELHLPIKGTSKGFEGTSKGFEDILNSSGSYVAFSTGPGQTATDEGENGGPYARALSAEIRRPGQEHYLLFQHVKENVYKSTFRTQLPWELNGLVGTVVLNGSSGSPIPIIRSEEQAKLDEVLNNMSHMLYETARSVAPNLR